MQSLCATAKREKSRRRFTLCCGRLPEKEESVARRCAKSPAERQNASQSLRPQAQMEIKSFLPATCASAKILLGSQTCERSECAAASRDPLKWESPAGLSHLNIKKGAPKGAPPPQCRRGQIRTCTTRQVGCRPTASTLPTSGIKPGGLQFTVGDRHPLYLMWV